MTWKQIFRRLLITVKPMEWDRQMPVHSHICMSGQSYWSMDGMSYISKVSLKLYKDTLLQPHKISSSYFSKKQYIFRPQDRPLLTPIYYPSDATSFWYDVSRCVVYRRNDGLLTSWNAIDTCAKIVMDPLSEFIWEPVNCSTRLPFMCNKGHNIRKKMNPTFII